MKVTINIECTPQEARAFMGLPDVDGLNEFLVAQMKARLEQNIAQMAPEEMIKTWSGFGATAQEQFFKLMQSAATASMSGFKGS